MDVDAGDAAGPAPAEVHEATSLIEADHVGVSFRMRQPGLRRAVSLDAVKDVSVTVGRGETLGLVGESGCGKTTLGLALVSLVRAKGSIRFDGAEITRMSRRELRPLRRRMQIIFQDPAGSLDPRMRVGDAIGEALVVHRLVPRDGRKARVDELLDLVGLLSVDVAALSARALGRPAAARLHRPRSRGRAGVPRLRRAGVCARRVGAGAGREPLGRPAEAARTSPTCSSVTTLRSFGT